MADTGWVSPTSLTNDTSVGDTSWLNPENASSSDDSKTVCNSLPGGSLSHYLKALQFGLSVPTGATVDGVEIRIEKRSGSPGVYDNEVKIVVGGTIGTINKAYAPEWPNTDTYIIYGSHTDLWGESLSPNVVNANDFGVVISSNMGSFLQAQIDHIQVKVYYTESGVLYTSPFPAFRA